MIENIFKHIHIKIKLFSNNNNKLLFSMFLKYLLRYDYVKPENKDKLRHYKYSGGEASLIYKYVLSPLA